MALIVSIDISEEVRNTIQQQIDPIKKKHPEYNWIDSAGYFIPIYYLPHEIKEDVAIQKIEKVLFDIPTFRLFALDFHVHIDHIIRILVRFHTQHTLEQIAKDIRTEFGSTQLYEPTVEIAKYRIPSRQQYKHLQTQLTQVDCDVEIPVDAIHIFSTKQRGDAEIAEIVHSFPLIKEE